MAPERPTGVTIISVSAILGPMSRTPNGGGDAID